jgi:hypothetical protein
MRYGIPGWMIDYYTTGDGTELCPACARKLHPALCDQDADEHGVSIDAFKGWGGPVFYSDENPSDIASDDGGRSVVCDNCEGVIHEHEGDSDGD